MSEYNCPACMGHHKEKECPLVDELRAEIAGLREIINKHDIGDDGEWPSYAELALTYTETANDLTKAEDELEKVRGALEKVRILHSVIESRIKSLEQYYDHESAFWQALTEYKVDMWNDIKAAIQPEKEK